VPADALKHAHDYRDAEGRFSLRDVTVVRVSQRPIAGSGIVMVWADFDVRERSGRRRRMYMLYFDEHQFIPPLRSRCDIIFELRPVYGKIGNTVHDIACDTGRWPSDRRLRTR
jgi:hypothetical protein